MNRRSMTAYGRACIDGYTVEVHSVNRKGLEINLFLPKELMRLDIDLRKRIKGRIDRGYVTVRVGMEKSVGAELPSKAALDAIKAHFVGAGFSESEITLPFLCDQYKGEVLTASDKIGDALDTALDVLDAMREQEAQALVKDIMERHSHLVKGVDAIEGLAKSAPEALRQKMNERLAALNVPKEDVAKEVVLFSEKCDVTEEIVRLKSHFNQFLGVINGKERSVGRTLDFILIEMGRELNTIASKSILHGMSDQVPLLKSECEKIREQVQNIE